MKIKYKEHNFKPSSLKVIEQATAICTEYYNQNLVLTLRQLYYQFVARGYMANLQANYNRLSNILGDARMAGQFDWDFLIDRTRNEISRPSWVNAGKMLEEAANQYHIDLWKGQGIRLIVFVEKDAAIGVIERVCHDNDVSYLSCRGYFSLSELWNATQRVRSHIENGERVVILHIGDHDPSGVDMSRDILQRMSHILIRDWAKTHPSSTPRTAGMIKQEMVDYIDAMREPEETREDKLHYALRQLLPAFSLRRIALTIEQIQEYGPPPNPAKETDSRYDDYVESTGLTESWELDALEPNVMIDLVQSEVDRLRNDAKWMNSIERRERDRLVLRGMSQHFQPVQEFIRSLEEK